MSWRICRRLNRRRRKVEEARYQRMRGLMGLCVRARQAVFGEDGCLKSIRAGQCGVLLMDAGASRATKEKYRAACTRTGTPLIELPADLIDEATGRSGVAMAVNQGGLADQLIGLMKSMTNESANHGGGASVE